MSRLDTVVAELKGLPPARLEQAAIYIHSLKQAESPEAKLALERAFGCLTATEADELTAAIEVTCDRVDASQWGSPVGHLGSDPLL